MSLPTNTADLLDVLAEEFPPRCMKRNEAVEDHIRYAAVVAFLQDLRDRMDNPQ